MFRLLNLYKSVETCDMSVYRLHSQLVLCAHIKTLTKLHSKFERTFRKNLIFFWQKRLFKVNLKVNNSKLVQKSKNSSS